MEVRPYRIIEDLGINTIKLTEQQIKGSTEIKQLIKDIKSGKAQQRISSNNGNNDKKKKDGLKKKKNMKKTIEAKRRPKLKDKGKNKRKGLKQRSKTVSNLDEKWKPPTWMNEVDQDHGYDFLASKPLSNYGKSDWKAGTVSVTAFNRKNNY